MKKKNPFQGLIFEPVSHILVVIAQDVFVILVFRLERLLIDKNTGNNVSSQLLILDVDIQSSRVGYITSNYFTL